MRLTSELIVNLIDRVTGPARRISETIGELPRRISAAQALNNRRMDEMRGRMLEAAGGAYVLAQAIGAPITAAIDMEAAMADVGKVVDFPTPEGLEAFKQSLIDMSRRIPMAATDLAAIAAAAGQADIAREDLLGFTEAAAKIGVAMDISAGEAGQAMAEMKTALGMSVEKVTNLADAINYLGNNQASGAPQVLNFTQRVASQAQSFGFAAKEAAALGSAMIAAGAAPEVAATSFLNMGRALTKGSSATKRQQEAFAALGLSAEDVARRMQEDATGTTQEVLERLAAIPDHMRAAVASDLFGDEARALGPLINNLDLFKESLGFVADEANYAGSAADEYNRVSETTAAHLKLLRNQVFALGDSIGSALLPPLNQAVASISPLVKRVSDLATRFPETTRAIVLGVSALVGVRVAALAASFSLRFLKGAALTVAKPFVASMVWMARSTLALLNPLRLVRNSIRLLKIALISSGVGAIVVGLGMAGAFIAQNWEGVKAAFGAFKTAFTKALGPVKPALDPVLGALSKLWGWVEKITGPLDTSTWVQFGETIGRVVGGVVKWVVNAFQGLIARVTDLIPDRIKEMLGLEVEAKPLTQAQMEDRAQDRAEDARDEADNVGRRASREERAAARERGQEAYDKEYAAAMAEMQAENARIDEARQAASLEMPELIFPRLPESTESAPPADSLETAAEAPATIAQEPAPDAADASTPSPAPQDQPSPTPPVQPPVFQAPDMPPEMAALLGGVPSGQSPAGTPASEPEVDPTATMADLDALMAGGGMPEVTVPAGLDIDPAAVTADLDARLAEATADLQMYGKVTLDLTDMDLLMQAIAQARAALSGLGLATRDAAARAAMSLDRSRATNLQDRPTS